jgi:hypothetical protein
MRFRSAYAAAAGKDGRRVRWMIQTARATKEPNRRNWDQQQPEVPTERRHVTGDGSLRTTVNVATENRGFAANSYSSIQPSPPKCTQVTESRCSYG